MTETYFRDVTDHGTLQRTARQHKVLIDRRQLDVAYWKDRVATKAGWKAQADDTDNTDDTDNPEAEEDDGLKISLNVLLALGGEAVTAVRSSSSQSSISVLISSKYFTSSLGGREGRKRI